MRPVPVAIALGRLTPASEWAKEHENSKLICDVARGLLPSRVIALAEGLGNQYFIDGQVGAHTRSFRERFDSSGGKRRKWREPHWLT